MRKSRIKIGEVDTAIITSIVEDPITVFDHLEPLSVVIPAWGSIVLLAHNSLRLNLDIMFFEDVQDFFIRYAKMTIRRPEEVNLYCFMNKGKGWKLFEPPTLIGANLTTRLRPQQKPALE